MIRRFIDMLCHWCGVS